MVRVCLKAVRAALGQGRPGSGVSSTLSGLQDNISLRKVIFVNPALQKPDTRKQLEERLFVLFRRDLFDRRTIELVP